MASPRIIDEKPKLKRENRSLPLINNPNTLKNIKELSLMTNRP
jgi:hypothetical protein